MRTQSPRSGLMDLELSYSQLILLPTFEERFRYLKLDGSVGEETFGFDRYLNQYFYRTYEWKKVRRSVILRDQGNDLAHEDHPIGGRVYIHHLNPITKQDIVNRSSCVLDPENLVCVSQLTHNAIHYGDAGLLLPSEPTIRKPNDTCPWK